ncbi:MAG: hypothetical protein NTV86_16910 [Planctomycetota bacterium]|nr:hypothetical protein [Planctomycetota bacterium]
MEQIKDGSTSGRALTVGLTAAAVAIIVAILAGLLYCHLNPKLTDDKGRVLVHPEEPFNYTREDGVIEWGTAVSFVGCGFLAGVLAWGARGLSRRQRICLAVFVALCLAAAGEELSWGERIFGVAAPEAMRARGQAVRFGHKGVSLHNVAFDLGFMRFSVGGVLFKLPLLVGGFFHGVLLPLALRQGKPWASRFVDKLGLFVPSIPLGTVMFLGIVLFYFRSLWPYSESQECREFYVPTVYFLILLEWWRLGRKGALVPAGA